MANKDYTYDQVKNNVAVYVKEASPQFSAGVQTMQQRLKQCGYDIIVDGLYGSGTETVVKSFQTECLLTTALARKH